MRKQEKAGVGSLDWKDSKEDKLIEAKATMEVQVNDFILTMVLHKNFFCGWNPAQNFSSPCSENSRTVIF